MINPSKINSPRSWRRWYKSGAVQNRRGNTLVLIDDPMPDFLTPEKLATLPSEQLMGYLTLCGDADMPKGMNPLIDRYAIFAPKKPYFRDSLFEAGRPNELDPQPDFLPADKLPSVAKFAHDWWNQGPRGYSDMGTPLVVFDKDDLDLITAPGNDPNKGTPLLDETLRLLEEQQGKIKKE